MISCHLAHLGHLRAAAAGERDNTAATDLPVGISGVKATGVLLILGVRAHVLVPFILLAGVVGFIG